MTTVLYADVLFIINFSMDFLSIFITAKLLSLKRSAPRFCIAALLGAFAATLMTAMGITSFLEGVITVLLAFGMTAIALGFGGIRAFLLRSFSLWGAGALLGGTVSVICSLGENTVIPRSTGGGDSPYFVILVAAAVLVLIFVRMIRPALARKNTRITIRFGEREIEVDALVDSGNLAVDPISGTPVIFLSHTAARSLLDEGDLSALVNRDREMLSDKMACRIRIIPISGEDGERIYFAFRPDFVGTGRKKTDALIALSEKDESFFAGNPALAPSCVL